MHIHDFIQLSNQLMHYPSADQAYAHRHTHIHLMAFSRDNLGKPAPER